MIWVIVLHENGRYFYVTDGRNLGYQPHLAKQYPSRGEAETGAIFLSLKHPDWIGRLEARELIREGRSWRI